jgi:short subunit dehydrogenase-like uncharacterized protein
MNVPWGDVSTAYVTTAIDNITVYWPASDAMIQGFKFSQLMRPLAGLGVFQYPLKMLIDWNVHGPGQEQRDRYPVYIWGEVSNTDGKTISARMTTANGYTVTQLAPIAIIEHLLEYDVTPASTTPALLMGKDFASSLPGSSAISICE